MAFADRGPVPSYDRKAGQFFEVEDPDMSIELSDPGDSMDTDSQQQEGE